MTTNDKQFIMSLHSNEFKKLKHGETVISRNLRVNKDSLTLLPGCINQIDALEITGFNKIYKDVLTYDLSTINNFLLSLDENSNTMELEQFIDREFAFNFFGFSQ